MAFTATPLLENFSCFHSEVHTTSEITALIEHKLPLLSIGGLTETVIEIVIPKTCVQ